MAGGIETSSRSAKDPDDETKRCCERDVFRKLLACCSDSVSSDVNTVSTRTNNTGAVGASRLNSHRSASSWKKPTIAINKRTGPASQIKQSRAETQMLLALSQYTNMCECRQSIFPTAHLAETY